MAKRVNTKFLFSLIALLVMVVAVAFGIYWWLNIYENNPTRLVATAKKALLAGNVDVAISNYQRAAVIAEKKHLPVAASLMVTLGDIYFSTTAANPHRFQLALSAWNTAVEINPSLLPAQIRLLDVEWKIAQLGRQRSQWQELKKTASTIIGLEPKNARAWRLRSQAEIQLLTGLTTINDAAFLQARHDLLQACHLAPADPKAFVNLATLYLQEANAELRQNLIGTKRAAELNNKGLQIMLAFVHAHPKNAQGWVGLADVYHVLPHAMRKARQSLDRALQLAPHDPHVLLAHVGMLLANAAKPDQVIVGMRRLIEADPNSMNSYLLLGRYQLQHGKPRDAIKTLLAGLHHPSKGEGLKPLTNRARRIEINQQLTQAYLQIAQELPSASLLRKEYLRHAADALAWVSQHQPASAWVTLYTGQLRFLQGRPDSALGWLKKAAAVLAPSNPAELPLWFRDHQLQSQVYQSMGQSGAALAELNEINATIHGQPLIILNRASLILAQDPQQSLADARRVLKLVPGNMEAITIEAKALATLNKTASLRKLLSGVDTAGNLQLAMLKARLAWQEGHFHQVVSLMKPWVVQAPGNSSVVLLSYAALAALNQRSTAIRLLQTAIHAAPDNIQFLVLSDQLADPKNAMPKINFAGIGSNVLSIVLPRKNSKKAQLRAINRLADPFLRNIMLFRYYMGVNDQASAHKSLAAAAKLQPENPDVMDAQLSLALAAKNFKSAKAIVARAVAANLDGVDGATFQARLDIARKDPGAAVKVLHSALSSHPYNTGLETYYGQALLLSGDINSGIATLRKALASAPDDISAIKPLVKYDLANPSRDTIENAMQLINQGLAYQPLDAQLNHWKNSLADLYGPPGPAITRREGILKSDPGDLDNVMRLGLLYSRNKQPAKAIALLKKAYAANPASLPLAEELGSLYSNNHHFFQAENLYGKLAESRNTQTALAARLLLGDVYAAQGNLPQAAQLYNAAIRIEPKGSQEAQRRLGDMYFAAGHFRKALTYYQEQVSTHAGHQPAIAVDPGPKSGKRDLR